MGRLGRDPLLKSGTCVRGCRHGISKTVHVRVAYNPLVAREIIGYLSVCSHWLVRAAARRLPAEERERFIDENLADLDAIEGPFSKLYNALGCFSAVCVLN